MVSVARDQGESIPPLKEQCAELSRRVSHMAGELQSHKQARDDLSVQLKVGMSSLAQTQELLKTRTAHADQCVTLAPLLNVLPMRHVPPIDWLVVPPVPLSMVLILCVSITTGCGGVSCLVGWGVAGVQARNPL